MSEKIIWKHILARRFTILRCELFTKGYVEPLEKYIGVPNRDLLVTKELEKYSLYNSLESLKEVSAAIISKLKKQENFGNKIHRDCLKSCENLVATSKKASRGNLETLASQALFDRLNLYFEASLEFTPFMELPINYELYITGHIKEFLSNKVGSKKVEKYLQKLMNPKKYPFQVLEQIDLAKIALKTKSSKNVNLNDLLKKHKQKYEWLSCYNFDESEFTLDDFRKRLEVLQSLSVTELESKTDNVIEKLNHNEIDFQKVVKELKLRGEILSKVKLLREFVFLRTYRIEMNSKSNFYLKPLLTEIARRGNVSLSELAMMLTNEIEIMLTNGKVPDSVNFKDRKKAAVFWLDNCVYNNAFGKDALDIISRQVAGIKDDKKVNKIKGTAASLGKTVKGKVRLINKDNMNEFVEGEVLVTTMTSPEFAPAMHKAIAIVTDEGGVLCHAAIVSREMKKPCIIGTKIATKVLRNGDVVEVNTKKGTVKIIKRHKKQ